MKTSVPLDLLLVGDRQLISLAYEPSCQSYQVEHTANPFKSQKDANFVIFKAVATDRHIFISSISETFNSGEFASIIKLTKEMKEIGRRKFQDWKIPAMATDGNTIFLSTEGKFFTLDLDLKVLGEVKFGINPNSYGINPRKNAHDILLYEDTAYLLDNVIEPVFILQIQTGDTHSPQIISKVEIIGVNHHLTHQWLNPDLSQWCIIQEYCCRGPSGTNILFFPLSVGDCVVEHGVDYDMFCMLGWDGVSGSREWGLEERSSQLLACQKILSHAWTSSPQSREWGLEGGKDILAITNLPPLWAIIQDEEKDIYLASVKMDRGRANLEKKIDLGSLMVDDNPAIEQAKEKNIISKPIMEFYDNYLYICIGTRILVIENALSPKLILNQDLSDFEIDIPKVSDIKVFNNS